MLQTIKSWLGMSNPPESTGSRERKKGRIIFFNRKKGYGFISSPDAGKDIFVHVSELKSRVEKGDKVAFSIRQESRGPKAVKVNKVEA